LIKTRNQGVLIERGKAVKGVILIY